jgi:hypothetical protein
MLWRLLALEKLGKPVEGIEHASTSRPNASRSSVEVSQFKVDSCCGNSVPVLHALDTKWSNSKSLRQQIKLCSVITVFSSFQPLYA